MIEENLGTNYRRIVGTGPTEKTKINFILSIHYLTVTF